MIVITLTGWSVLLKRFSGRAVIGASAGKSVARGALIFMRLKLGEEVNS